MWAYLCIFLSISNWYPSHVLNSDTMDQIEDKIAKFQDEVINANMK